MALYVDSADLAVVADLLSAYPIAGVTTNPSILLAAIEGGQRLSDLEVLRALLDLNPRLVFMQPVGEDAEALRVGAMRYIEVDARRVVPKLPLTRAGMRAGLALKREGVRIAFTAVFSLPQTYSAAMSDADWVIPYVGRLRRAGLDACQRIEQMKRLLAAHGGGTRILAASMKTPADIVEATLAGAHDITAQPEIIRLLTDDGLTAAAVEQFALDEARGRATLG
ncbi:MAG: hypothetical protein IVW57_08090 [Ktedonobacterales bacterium]|nr:hypothetical protein [Ktedonobacterales bacterium]